MDSLIQYWLLTLCNTVQGVARAVVASQSSGDTTAFVAQFPEELTGHEELQKIIETGFAKKKTIFYHNVTQGKSGGEPQDVIVSPLFVEGAFYGLAVLQMSTRVTVKQKLAVGQVENAAIWFGALYKQRSLTQKNQLGTVVELVSSCLEHENFQAAATEVLTNLTLSFSCERISLGVCKAQEVVVEAVSHSGGFDRRSNLVQATSDAMGEAIEQSQTVRYPKDSKATYYTRCHQTLVKESNVSCNLTVPIVLEGKIVGAILAESFSQESFDSGKSEQFEQIVSLIGPILHVRYQNEQWLLARIHSGVKEFFGKFVGAGNVGFKLVAILLAIILGVVSFVDVDYRVTGQARLEAKNQRVVVAPQDGYIAESKVRPGDIIRDGELLATLDDKDLKLEYQKWSSQLEQLQREYRGALAQHDRSRVNIIQARMAQAEAQMSLVQEQFMRSRFVAPFDGIVVSGDLSQALGAPVERGQVLFTVAPLVAYRVVLMVDERDIGHVKKGQQGKLLLSSMSGDPMTFTVDSITPVSKLEDGRNYFQVEAKIAENSDMLRPGMEGIGKIVIEPRRLLWVWSHRVVDWFRLAFWSIRP